MVHLKSEEEIAFMREGGRILSQMHGMLATCVAPGVTLKKLDLLAEEFLRDHGGKPSFKGYQGYPSTLCTSVNQMVVHGIPSAYCVQEGDIIAIDCGFYYNGYHTDQAFTHSVGMISSELKKLLEVTRQALMLGIEQVRVGNRLGDIGNAIQNCVEANGFFVVQELGGHGIGVSLHEDPHVKNFGRSGVGAKLKQGMVLAIEPIVVQGNGGVSLARDGWTVVTCDGTMSAHFEHTVALGEKSSELLTTFAYIDDVNSGKYVKEAGMAKSGLIEQEGVVEDALPNAVFKVRLQNNVLISAHISGRMRRNYIKILPGDKVRVEISPYDLTKGRIVYREKT